MNSLMQQSGAVLDQTQALRRQLREVLEDADLGYSPGGDCPTLGALYRELGETTLSYVDAFRTFEQDFGYRFEDSSIETSVSRLHDWLTGLEQELRTVLESLSEEAIATRVIDRGHGFGFPVGMALHVYREALLIFCGKASVYLKALSKELPEQWRHWIG